MKLVPAALAAAAFAFTPLALHAQDAPRPYDQGPVWTVDFIQTKPGHFDDYMRWLATRWRTQENALKAAGAVLDYKVLSAVDARDNEPNVVLMVEWKNMAQFDTPLDEIDAMTRKMFGSMAAANASDVDRETIRTQHGSIMLREMVLK